MSLVLAALALLGTAGWFLLLARGEMPASRFRLVVEALAVETVTATLVAVALVSFESFRPDATLALAACLPLVILAKPNRERRRPLSSVPLVSREDGLLVLVLVLMAPVVLPRMEELRMDWDAGVYSNRAIHHLETGGLLGDIPVRGRLEGELRTLFDQSNMTALEGGGEALLGYLPGTYVASSDPTRFHFQFFPGWPMVMALWAAIFGVAQASSVLVFLYALGVLLFGIHLDRLGVDLPARILTVAIFASSPLLLYFAKHTTSETLLLFAFLFVLHLVGGESRLRAVLAAAGVLLLAVSHSSTFLYAPLLALPLLEAHRSSNRRMALFSALAFGALLTAIPLGHVFSPYYLRDVYQASFQFMPVSDPATAGLAVVSSFYLVGLALSCAALARAGRPSARTGAVVARAERCLAFFVPVTLVVMAAWTAWRGYQLGWTDHFPVPAGGAWVYRSLYVGQGWAAVAHLDIVSMMMATSLVGLPTVLFCTMLRKREVSATPGRLFLLCAVLWTLAVYTFFRVDTPFNYYASRYFLPVFVPATLLLFGSLLGHSFPSRWRVALVVVALGFNLYFDRGLYLYPSEFEKRQFVDEVARKVGTNRVLFVRADETVFRLLAIQLQSRQGISVVRVERQRGLPEATIIERYAAALDLASAAVLSGVAPRGGHASAVLSLVERGFSHGMIIYPTSHTERHLKYYLYDVEFSRGAGAGRATGS